MQQYFTKQWKIVLRFQQTHRQESLYQISARMKHNWNTYWHNSILFHNIACIIWQFTYSTVVTEAKHG